MPISAILFGGRRASNVPLVTEAFDWRHGVFLASILSSEKTAAAAGTVGELRFDPFAMLLFCGYHMADDFAHWLALGARAAAGALPRLYQVNWFRKGADGRFLWPGFGENARVLAWVIERLEGRGRGVESPIGVLPAPGAIDTRGLALDDATMAALLAVDREAWRSELAAIRAHYATLGDRLPAALRAELDAMAGRLGA